MHGCAAVARTDRGFAVVPAFRRLIDSVVIIVTPDTTLWRWTILSGSLRLIFSAFDRPPSIWPHGTGWQPVVF